MLTLFAHLNLLMTALLSGAKKNKERGYANVIIAGESYGQGSSREHAALCPSYLGVRAVIAKSIERSAPPAVPRPSRPTAAPPGPPPGGGDPYQDLVNISALRL